MLLKHTGYERVETYRYWDSEIKGIDFDGMCEDLQNAPENAVIILHTCAHNPTGCDPTKEQWQKLSEIIKVGTAVFLPFPSHLSFFF